MIFKFYARIFLTKLILKYGLKEEYDFSKNFTAKQYKVLDYIAIDYGKNISLEGIAAKANHSLSLFAGVFKQTIARSPYQFLMFY